MYSTVNLIFLYILFTSGKYCFSNVYGNGVSKPVTLCIGASKYSKQFSDINTDIIDNADYIVNLQQKKRRENPSKIIKIEKNGSITKLR